VEDRTRELSALSNHLQALSEREKSELARKLHDELGGLLTAAKMDLSWLQSRLEGAAIQERLAQLGSVLDEAMDLKRRVVEDLRPSLLDHFGLPTALRAYVESTCAKAGLASQIVIEHACEAMSKDTTIALFRVVQEGLSNIIRHAQAKTVKLELSGDDGHCIVTLTDDGQGFDARSPRIRWSHGLMGMRQRAEAFGGRLDIESQVGGGTRVRVEIPIARQ
jgi:signal transduction histidine kinase